MRKRPDGRVLIDTLQNARGKPLAAPYSVRPFPAAPVSTPIAPGELSAKLVPEQWTIKTVPARIAKLGDLWRDFWTHCHRLEEMVSSLESSLR